MTGRRRSDVFLAVLAALVVLVGFTAGDTLARGGSAGTDSGRALARSLGLTDLALATEARYTRHPALADRYAPFQDHPGALDHFPSGSVIPPPDHLAAP